MEVNCKLTVALNFCSPSLAWYSVCVVCLKTTLICADYSEKRVVSLLNSDLADTLGNLVQRVTAKKLHANKERGFSLAQWGAVSGPVSGAEDFVLLERLKKLSGSKVCTGN